MKTEDGQFILSGAKRSCASIRELLHCYQREALRADGYTFQLSRCCPPSLKGQRLQPLEVTIEVTIEVTVEVSSSEHVCPRSSGPCFTLFTPSSCGIYWLLTDYLTLPAAAN